MVDAICAFILQGRLWVMKIVGRVIAAPFFAVKFADFFFGDQMNSLTTSILDLYLLFCYFGTGLVSSCSFSFLDFSEF